MLYGEIIKEKRFHLNINNTYYIVPLSEALEKNTLL